MPDAGLMLDLCNILEISVTEQKAGYFECKHCGKKHVPEFKNVVWSMHLGTTHYMKCPECGKRSW